MSESSQLNPESGPRVVLLDRGGDLSEFADCLSTLGIPFASCLSWPTEAQVESAGLIVASAHRLLESGQPDLSNWPRTLAVVQDASKTISAHLNRIGVGLVLNRPIHPRALRLILLHEIYRGPERRNLRRTAIGHPVRVKIGLFAAKATLLELSPSGARIQVATAPKIGQKIRLVLGRELTCGRPLKLAATVVRRIETGATSKRPGCEIGLSIQDARKHAKTINAVLDRFASGPAVWAAGDASTSNDASSVTTECGTEADDPNETTVPLNAATPEIQAPDPSESQRNLPPTRNQSADGLPPARETSEASGADERRTDQRIPYSRRVVALDEEAARVLVGRDLSQGGMRIMSNANVSVDDELKVALHCGTEMEPLVVHSTVLRDDGDDGLVLTFAELNPRQVEHLEKIIASSGPIRATASAHAPDEADTDSLVIGEVLE